MLKNFSPDGNKHDKQSLVRSSRAPAADSFPRRAPRDVPAKSRVKMMMSWYTAWPRMFFIMVLEMRGLSRPYGLRSSSDSVGGSVARARDASVSMMRLTQSIWTALRGESCRGRTPQEVNSQAELVTHPQHLHLVPVNISIIYTILIFIPSFPRCCLLKYNFG